MADGLSIDRSAKPEVMGANDFSLLQERAAALHDRQKGALDFCIEAGYERVITSDGGIFFLGHFGQCCLQKTPEKQQNFE